MDEQMDACHIELGKIESTQQSAQNLANIQSFYTQLLKKATMSQFNRYYTSIQIKVDNLSLMNSFKSYFLNVIFLTSIHIITFGVLVLRFHLFLHLHCLSQMYQWQPFPSLLTLPVGFIGLMNSVTVVVTPLQCLRFLPTVLIPDFLAQVEGC